MLEKQMEDQIAAQPERFLEKDLKLMSRQLRIGNYRFDLLFEDRHGGKLIVEIQRGTLDREHTYKILDYYHEYRDQNPQDFIDLMVVANQIPAERKKRLLDLGIEFRELPISLFDDPAEVVPEPVELSGEPVHEQSSASPTYPVLTPLESYQNDSYHFASLGPSAFINSVRKLLRSRLSENRWKLGGDASLIAISLSTTEKIDSKIGSGLKAQIWMERPKKGRAACKFEVAYTAQALGPEENKVEREKIAASIRHHLVKQGLPPGVTGSTGSTVVRRPLNLPAINSVDDDTEEVAEMYQGEATQLVDYVWFLDEALATWPAVW